MRRGGAVGGGGGREGRKGLCHQCPPVHGQAGGMGLGLSSGPVPPPGQWPTVGPPLPPCQGSPFEEQAPSPWCPVGLGLLPVSFFLRSPKVGA